MTMPSARTIAEYILLTFMGILSIFAFIIAPIIIFIQIWLDGHWLGAIFGGIGYLMMWLAAVLDGGSDII